MKNIFDNKKRKIKETGFILLILLIPFLSLLLIESIHRGSFVEAVRWVHESSGAFVVSYLFFLFFILSFNWIPIKIFIPFLFIQMGLWSLIAFGSYKKYQLRGEYLLPSDVGLIREGITIINAIEKILTLGFVIGALLSLIFVITVIFILNKVIEPVKFRWRLLAAAVSVISLFVLALNPGIFSYKARAAVNTTDEYQKLGLIGGFLNLNKKSELAIPETYDEKNIQRIIKSLPDDKNVDQTFKPNIIVVLAEAFWDPLLLTDLTFEKDPIPFFRSLVKEGQSGELLTHVFGGGTVNTELEVLTGLSTRFLPPGQETYSYRISRPIDSLAHVLRNQGYHTTAIHNFKNWFYDRDKIYKWLGFEKFVSMEFFSDPEYIGPYIDDRELMKKTIEELKKTEGPDFIHVVTVSSHGPYDDIRYPEGELKGCGNTPKLTDVPQYILDLYCQVLNETDDALRYLIEGVEELDEPTMVVVYGDHLPMLGYDYAVYREVNYFKSLTSYEDYLKLYTTPLVIWDNFSNEKPKEKIRMTPNFLGSYILSHAKKEKSDIFKMTEYVYKNITTVIPKKEYFKQEGIDEKLLTDYETLQYDILFGNQYSYKNYPVKPVKNYFLGSERMFISSAKLSTDNKELELTGKGFVSNAKIFVNDTETESIYFNENFMKALLPNDLNHDNLHVVLKVIDDKEQVIAESNKFKITKN